LEGVHTSYFLYNGALSKRKVFLRLHNVEWKYYSELRKTTRSLPKKLYFAAETILLKKYEKEIAPMVQTLAVSEADSATYRSLAPGAKADYLPVFIPWDRVTTKEGMGSFCLYHGNLSVAENEKAVEWLIHEIFSKTEIPLSLRARRPSAWMQNLPNTKNACLLADPRSELGDVIEKAQVHILPSFNNTGIKLKLLHALFRGGALCGEPEYG
jgi:hypothetical protein